MYVFLRYTCKHGLMTYEYSISWDIQRSYLWYFLGERKEAEYFGWRWSLLNLSYELSAYFSHISALRKVIKSVYCSNNFSVQLYTEYILLDVKTKQSPNVKMDGSVSTVTLWSRIKIQKSKDRGLFRYIYIWTTSKTHEVNESFTNLSFKKHTAQLLTTSQNCCKGSNRELDAGCDLNRVVTNIKHKLTNCGKRIFIWILTGCSYILGWGVMTNRAEKPAGWKVIALFTWFL